MINHPQLTLAHLTWNNDPLVEVVRANGWNVEHRPFHQLLVESLGVEGMVPQHGSLVSKLFDHGFGNQTLLSYGVVGTHDGNLGAEIHTGSAARFDHSGRYERLFNDALEDYLLRVGFSGWISIGSSGGNINVAHGLPFLSNFHWLESMDRPPREWFECPSRLLESWSVALLVSRFPFPQPPTSQAPGEVVFSREMRRHFSPLFPRGGQEFGKVRTPWGAIGVASGWAKTLGGAVERAEGVARRVGVEGKQVRMDVRAVVESLIQEQHNICHKQIA